MNEAITSYETLMEEQQRLKDKLQLQKIQIQQDIAELKQELQPVLKVASFVGKMAIPDVSQNSAVQTGAGMTIEWIAKKVLGKTNPILGLILPTLIKNYSSHYIEKAIPLIKKLKDKIIPKKIPSRAE